MASVHSWNDDGHEVHICFLTTDEAANLQLVSVTHQSNSSPLNFSLAAFLSHLLFIFAGTRAQTSSSDPLREAPQSLFKVI